MIINNRISEDKHRALRQDISWASTDPRYRAEECGAEKPRLSPPGFGFIAEGNFFWCNGCMHSQMRLRLFKKTIWEYYRRAGRDFPWRRTRDPYRIFVSEVMLQQTQADRVRSFYTSFLKRFPAWGALARARQRDALIKWQGLGYNRRALALHRTAQIVVREHGGKLPRDVETLELLPGVGRATAGAIAAFAFDIPSVFIETNIRRAVLHFFFPRGRKVSDIRVRELVAATLDRSYPREWYYALMDYGAMLAKKAPNSNRRSKHYTRQSPFPGSVRQLRGAVIRFLTRHGAASVSSLAAVTGRPPALVKDVVVRLAREGFVSVRDGKVMLL